MANYLLYIAISNIIHQARNFMRDQMRIGELAFFYHSNCKEPGIAGLMEVRHASVFQNK